MSASGLRCAHRFITEGDTAIESGRTISYNQYDSRKRRIALEQNKSLADRGQETYDRTLKHILEPAHKGKFVAIEVDSEDYFLGSTPIEAINRGKQKHPSKVFFVARVGFRAAFQMKRRR